MVISHFQRILSKAILTPNGLTAIVKLNFANKGNQIILNNILVV